MPTFDQTQRLLAIKTPLAKDEVLLTSFSGSEEMSRPFVFHLDVVSSIANIQPDDIVGQKITAMVQWFDAGGGGNVRYFHGYVSRLSVGQMVTFDLREYQIEMVSPLWFLALQADCCIFQNMKVPDIVTQVISQVGLPDAPVVADRTQGHYPPLDFCVQYRETKLDFISRLMEQAGIYYFFDHDEQDVRLVLADNASGYAAGKDVPYAPFYGGGGMGEVTSWAHRYSLISGKYTHTDFNFETPTTALLKSTPTVVLLKAINKDKFEIFDYPGLYSTGDDGKSLADLRMQEIEAAYDVMSGRSTNPLFGAGTKFNLTGHPTAAENKQRVVVSVAHDVRDAFFSAESEARTVQEYSNTFNAIPSGTVFCPPRTTRLPIVHGPQTAVVVGAKGDEITTDKYGRVKVQFFWDRVGKNDDKSSCFVRVAQAWGGKNWGLLFTPRVGDEVLVDFLEGNPDRPIIIGSVYNADNLPPYKIAKDDGSPDEQLNYSGIKTFSTKNGTAGSTFNELRFKDDAGKEEIFFHAERDYLREVENNDTLTVGIENDANGNPAVGVSGKATGNQTITVFNNQTLTIGKKVGNTAPADGSQSVEIWKNQTVTIGKGGSDCQDGSQTASIFKDQTVTIGNNQTLNIGDSKSADGSQTVNIWKARTVTLKSGDDSLTVTQGNQTVQIKAGSSSLEAMQSILLKVGDNSIKIAPDGITIKGTLVDIQATTALKAKGLTADVLADAALTLKGAIAKIN